MTQPKKTQCTSWRRPVWKWVLNQFCPRCDRSLALRIGSSGFFFYCDHCIYQWRVTAADEKRFKLKRKMRVS